MRTRNSNFPNNSNVTILRRRNRGRAPNIVEPELCTLVEVAPMAERTMEDLLRAPTEGYGEAIVLPKINADHFEIKTNLLQLVQANPFHGYERENPHAHINSFKRITLTLRFRDVPNDVAFCILEDLTAFYLKISLHFASRPHSILLQDLHCILLEDLIAFCLKTSLRFASRPHCILLHVITAFCFNIIAFCSRPPLRFT
ncbi:hypothetical protein Tco_0813395 [Tanacetum coccineum]